MNSPKPEHEQLRVEGLPTETTATQTPASASASEAPSLWVMVKPQLELLWADRRHWHRRAWAATKEYFRLHDDHKALDGLKDFVTDADHFILHQKPIRGHLIIRIALVALLVFVLWAAITHVDELVKGDGKVVPSSQLQVLQSLDGGIVQEILVKEARTPIR